MVTIQPKTWHWSLGGNTGVVEHDLQRAIRHGGVCIHGVTEEWIEERGGGKLRRGMMLNFVENARAGDKIFIFCKGKIRASGTFTGEIFRISNEEALWCAVSASHHMSPQNTGSFKAMVYDWKVFEEPKDGAGLRGTLYEVKQGMKNYHNYQ